jgi:uncharacterized protein (TIGR04255 family)
MTARPLPQKLKKEPLVDAIFEVRFSSSTTASNVIPGFFFAKLEPKEWVVDSLPIAEVPSKIRSDDPNLRYQPLMRIHWDNFLILVGDNTLGVACKMPYSGWSEFRERIIKIIGLLVDAKIVKAFDRYSLKYVDVIEDENLAKQIQMINMDIRIGSHKLKEEIFTVRLEIPYDIFINVIQIGVPATATMPEGQKRIGALVSIDTICRHQTNDLIKFTSELPTRLDAIHIENKKMFFDCLTQETIDYLEPVYG